MADRFWVGNGGNWSDNTNHWSASDGGAANASKPGTTDSVFFTASSFSAGSEAVVIDEVATCLDMTWTGVSDTPALTITNQLQIFGSLTAVTGMTVSGTGGVRFRGASSHTITTAGQDFNALAVTAIGGTYTLQDTLTLTVTLTVGLTGQTCILDTNSQAITCAAVSDGGSTGGTLTLGATILTCTDFIFNAGSQTVNAGTSTIIVNQGVSMRFRGGGYTYNIVELNGNAHTITDSNTFKILRIGRGAATTITGTAGTTQTVTYLLLAKNTNILTLDSTGAAWTITGNRGYFEGDYMDITGVTATPKNLYYAGDHSTDSGSNTDWTFTRKVRPTWRVR